MFAVLQLKKYIYSFLQGPRSGEVQSHNCEITMELRGTKMPLDEDRLAQSNESKKISCSLETKSAPSKKKEGNKQSSSSKRSLKKEDSSPPVIKLSDSSGDENPSPKRKKVSRYIDSDSE